MRSTACRIALAFLLSQGPALKRLSTVACRRRRGDHGQEGAVSARDIPERACASSAQEDASPLASGCCSCSQGFKGDLNTAALLSNP